jgi:PHP family Zn ribbon phosphoesterase
VTEECQKIYHALGDEFTILRKLPITQIQAAGFNLLAVAIQRIRSGEVIVRSGYDGVYGVIRVFKDDDERQELLSRLS